MNSHIVYLLKEREQDKNIINILMNEREMDKNIINRLIKEREIDMRYINELLYKNKELDYKVNELYIFMFSTKLRKLLIKLLEYIIENYF